jgi:hypothetical protein
MITLSDVKVWGMFRGIGHVVMSHDAYSMLGTQTACNSIGNVWTITRRRPRRICKRCRAALNNVEKLEGDRP